METHYNLGNFFSKELETLNCDDITRAYITGIFSKFQNSISDYSQESITLLYAEAVYRQDFITFDNIGSWLFYCQSLYPEHLNNASIDYYHSLGQMSYYSCYRLINRKLKLYEQLADMFSELSLATREILQERLFIRKL